MKNFLYPLLMLLVLTGHAQTEASSQYDKIGSFNQGVAFVWKGGKMGLISQQGMKEIIKPEYDRISNFGRDAIAYTTKNGLVGLIDMQGHVIVGNIYGSISPFHGFYAITRKNGLAGMINKKGKVVVENKYEKIDIDRHGMVRAVINGKEVILEVKDES
jgi:hypothetical protein